MEASPLRIALPKGRLLEGVLAVFGRAGLRFTFRGDRDYRPTCSLTGVSAKLIKVRAIPQLVALGNFELGLCGKDLVEEADDEPVVPLLDLGLDPVELVVAVPRDREDLLERSPRRPVFIATEYERIADRWALARGLSHVTIQTHGSTEGYAPEDADVVLDCVATGRTLAANDLVVVERLMRSTTWLVANRAALGRPETRRAIDDLVARLARAAEETP